MSYTTTRPRGSPPGRPRGRGAGVILVRAREVDLTEVLDACHTFTGVLRPCFVLHSGAQGEVPLGRFLTIIASPVALIPFFKQLVWQLGTSMDMSMAKAAESRGQVPDRSSLSVTSFERKLAQYVAANQRHFAEQSNLSICLDAGRVGQRQVVAGVLVDSSGVGFAYPPQEPRGIEWRLTLRVWFWGVGRLNRPTGSVRSVVV